MLICAQPAFSPAYAACDLFNFSVAQPVVERFVFRPETLLSEYREGGAAMVHRVLIISASSRAALQALSRQVPRGNVRQRQAIAAGMAVAAVACDRRSRDQTRAIERVARDITDSTFQQEYRARNEAFRLEADARLRERAILEALGGASRQDAGGRGNSLFSSRDLGPVQALGEIPPVPFSVPPIR